MNLGFEIGNIMEDFDNHIPLKADEDDQFPIGLRVLAIDNNIVCLRYLVQLLKKCQYKVTATTEAAEAIRLLKDEKQTFDIVITNVVRHDMDGFKILQIIGVGMDIPVVIVSANEEFDTMMRGVLGGAKDYLLKPVRLQELRNIWQHVLRKRLARKSPNPNLLLLEEQVVLEEEEEEEDHNITKRVAINQQDYDQSNAIVKLNDGNNYVADDSSSKKKKRVSWTKELHDKFLEAYEQLGEKERVPNNILKLMNDSRLTRENVASHLQKHRDTLKKKKASGVGKLGSHRNLYDRNPTKGSTIIYSSINQINKVPNLGPQFGISNGQGNQNHRSTWTAAGSFFPVPESKGFNFPSNNSTPKPCEDDNQKYLGGFDDPSMNIINSYYPPLQTNNCNFNSTSQNLVGYNATENHNYDGAGQCYQMQLNAANSLENYLLMDDELSNIFKQVSK